MTKEEKDFKLSCNYKNFNYIQEKFENNLFCINFYKVEKKVFEQFKNLMKSVEEIYTDQWDFNFELTSEGTFSIRSIDVYFPQFKIKNSKGLEHDIKDFFLRLELSVYEGRLQIQDVKGSRATVTYAEYSSNYGHSHLSFKYRDLNSSHRENTTVYFKSFCKGSGHINTVLSEINCEGITEELAQNLVLQTYLLITWESLEGGPHRKIRDINVNFVSGSGNRQYSSISLNMAENIKEHIVKDCKEKNVTLNNVSIGFENKRYYLSEPEELKTFLVSNLESYSPNIKNNLFSVKRGNYYMHRTCLNNTAEDNLYFIPPEKDKKEYIHNGKVFKFTIEDLPVQDSEIEETLTIEPKTLTLIKNKIDEHINKSAIRKSTIERYSN